MSIASDIAEINERWKDRALRDDCYADAKRLVAEHPSAFDDIRTHSLEALVQLIDVLRGDLEAPAGWRMPADPAGHIARIEVFLLATFPPQHISGRVAIGVVPEIFVDGLEDIDLAP